MAFAVSYNSISSRDIKHIYSDQTIKFVHPVRRSFLPLKEERPLPPLKKYPRRFYEYYPEMKIGIPRAPAFRQTDEDNVNRIVNRICKPIQCQRARRKDLLQADRQSEQDDHLAGMEGSQDEHQEDSGSDTSRSDATRGRLSTQEWSELLARLQKPTESSRRKTWRERKLEDERENAWKSEVPKLPPIDPIW